MKKSHFSIFYFIIFCTCIKILIKASDDHSKEDYEIFIKLLNYIPTLESERIHFSDKELKQFIAFKSDKWKNNLLNDKYKKKIVALRCIYTYAIKIILEDLDISSIDKRHVTFNNTAELLLIDKNSSVMVSEILKKRKIDLTNIREQSIRDITENQSLNQLYKININNKMEVDDNIINNHCHLKLYVRCIARMISVLIMSQSTIANWMWMIFLYLKAIEKNLINKNGFLNYIKNADTFIDQCSCDNYLGNIELNKIIDFKVDGKLKEEIDVNPIYFLEKLKLISDNENLIPIFKYENMLGIYDIFWTKNESNLINLPKIKCINWDRIKIKLDFFHNNADVMLNKDPFSITKFYQIVSDIMKIVLVYHSYKHLKNYIENRWSIITNIRLKATRKNTQKTLEWFLESPLDIIKLILQFLDINNDDFYKNIVQFFDINNKDDQSILDDFINHLLIELKNLLNKYNAFDDNLNKNITKYLTNNIYDLKITECSISLLKYYDYFKKIIEPLNFYVINLFEMSKCENWI
ncbi:uncharacterized protein LOC126895631 [Daktulosphaira vitifoliae]|uniref:uncharacterized protein LOC126895631 n=1 Tax=Daktulosphaira vitifoliae TaxID=58002 RepID=UPI0021AA9B43|nr:uncharacterized protein LOC126895631 [Daktulosphaira vitifoliae]